MKPILSTLAAAAWSLVVAIAAAQAAFVHPGLFYTRADLERIKREALSGQEPWRSDYALLTPDPNHAPRPVADETIAHGQFEIRKDARVASDLALKWYITGDREYALGAIRIIDAWSGALRSFDAGDNLSASEAIQGFGEAAEILTYTDPSPWSADGRAKYKDMMLHRLYPAVSKARTDGMMGNQGIDAVMAAMVVGIALDIPEYFNDGVRAWTDHPCVAIQDFILPTGQVAEVGRDQPHAAGELTAASRWALLASHQGIDLYSAANNRLLAGYEYWTKYNLGYDVPFTQIKRCNYGYRHISKQERGRLGFVDFQRIYRHYVVEKGLSAPYVTLALARVGSGLSALTDAIGVKPSDQPTIADGTYKIISKANGFAISVPSDSTANDTQVDLEQDTSPSSASWTFTNVGGNIYRIINRRNKILELPGTPMRSGAILQINNDHGGLTQCWRVVKNPDGSYSLFNAVTSWGVVLAGDMGASGPLKAAFVPTTPNAPLNAEWTLEPASARR